MQLCSGLNISKEEVERSYSLLGVPVEPDPLPLRLSELKEKYPSACSQESEMLLQSVLSKTDLPFEKLSDYQAFCINALLTHHNILCVAPTALCCYRDFLEGSKFFKVTAQYFLFFDQNLKIPLLFGYQLLKFLGKNILSSPIFQKKLNLKFTNISSNIFIISKYLAYCF